MRKVILGLLPLWFFVVLHVGAKDWIVEDGRPNAAIVVAEEAPSLVAIAAGDLRDYILKISGATLPIVTEPDPAAVNIYVGRSAYTDKLGVTDADLEHGAYRIKSGPRYLVLLGHDMAFTPPVPEISARGSSDRERAQAAWNEMTRGRTDGVWGNPYSSMHRNYNAATDTWFYEQSGSMNAVYGFLRDLGVRWYLPGEVGEVVPNQSSLALPEIDRVVRPDFPVRRFFGPAYFVMSRDDLLWMRRLGLNQGYPVLGLGPQVHGMRNMLGQPEMFAAHPEYYALIAGRRWYDGNRGQACFSSEALTREAVNYARAMFDLLDEPAVDLWPEDGLRMCECDKCAGLSPAEAVFGFVDRVAREVYQTHPDRMITCGAYSSYRLPPGNVVAFPPNVGITVAYKRPGLDQPEAWAKDFGMTYEEFIGGWCAKAGKGRMICNSNHRGPVLMPRSIAADLRARRGRSMGDWNEVGHLAQVGDARGGRSVGRQTWRLGLHHLNLYVNAHLLWDAEQDLEHMLDEYYRLFYGPVADQVQAAFEFAEANYTRGQGAARLPLEDQVRLTEMLHAARELAGDTIYAQRITCILEEEKSLEALRREVQEAAAVAEERARAPLAAGRDRATDGETPTYALVDLTTGETPPIKTTFQVEWDAGMLIFDIRCEDPDMENLFVTKDVWGGDSVAILIETPFHAYYQMEINPDGDLVDADREFGKVNMNWNSMAEVQPERGADYWRVIVRIPVMDEAAGALDPLHNVVGEKPTQEAPWFIQVGRVRIRGFDKTAYGFTATGRTYHNRQKFGRLVIE